MSRKSFSKFRSRWWAFCEIERQIRRGRSCTNGTLAEDLEVDPRTVRRYIAFLKEDLDAPIEWNPIDQRYELTDSTWTMPNVHLSDQEMLALAVASKSLGPVTPAPFGESLEKLLGKLMDALPLEQREELQALQGKIDFVAAAVPSKGAEWVTVLMEAMRRGVSVGMTYHVLSRDRDTEREVDPYHLRFFAGTWYLIGFDHLTKHLPVFSLARIKRLEITERSFRSKSFSAGKYFENTFGITTGGSVREIRVRLSGRAAKTAGEKVWPKGFSYKEGDDGTGVLVGQVGKLDDVLAWMAPFDGEATLVVGEGVKM